MAFRVAMIVTVLACVAAVCPAQEEDFTMSTYYPSPSGVYDMFRLVPRENPGECREGEIYYDNGKGTFPRGLYLCNDVGTWQRFGTQEGFGGIYKITDDGTGQTENPVTEAYTCPAGFTATCVSIPDDSGRTDSYCYCIKE